MGDEKLGALWAAGDVAGPPGFEPGTSAQRANPTYWSTG